MEEYCWKRYFGAKVSYVDYQLYNTLNRKSQNLWQTFGFFEI